MLRVGLTGGIACGKSVVRRALDAAGLATIDLDDVARSVMAPGGAAYARVRSAFGPHVVAADGTIDRTALGALVFADAGARARLDAIVHPEVRAAEAARLARLEEEGCPVAVSDGAVLVEAGAHLRFDRLIVVHCDAATQLARLVDRDGIDEEAARARIGAQMPVDLKRRFAHLEIDSGADLGDTLKAAREMARTLVSLAARGARREAADRARALASVLAGTSAGPRGLDARQLLGQVERSGGIDLVGTSARLVPPSPGPWYRPRGPWGAPWPEALAVVPVLWGLGRGADVEWQDSAAATLARLTHPDDAAIAGACLAARLLRHVLTGGSLASAEDRLAEDSRAALRWGGAPPDPRVLRALEMARDGNAAAAWSRAERHGAEPAFASALAAAGAEGTTLAVPPEIGDLVDSVLGPGRG